MTQQKRFPALKKQAEILRDEISQLGAQAGQRKALDILSKIAGVKNFNTLSATAQDDFVVEVDQEELDREFGKRYWLIKIATKQGEYQCVHSMFMGTNDKGFDPVAFADSEASTWFGFSSRNRKEGETYHFNDYRDQAWVKEVREISYPTFMEMTTENWKPKVVAPSPKMDVKISENLGNLQESIEKAVSALYDAQNVVDPYQPGTEEFLQLVEMSEASDESQAVERGHTGAYMFEIHALQDALRKLQAM